MIDPRVDPSQIASSRNSPAPVPFDMSSLRQHLVPSPSARTQSHPISSQPRPRNQNWAGSFTPNPQMATPVNVPSSTTTERSQWAQSFDPKMQPQRNGAPPAEAHMTGGNSTSNVAPWQRPQYPPAATMPSMYMNQYAQQTPYHSAMPVLRAEQHHPAFHSGQSGEEIHIHQDHWPTAADFDRHADGEIMGGPVQVDQRTEAELEEPLPEVNWRDDVPSDLEAVLRVPPTIPELLPLRPGASAETIPRQQGDGYGYTDQSAILMSELSSSPSTRPKSVHFRESSGVPSSLEEALAQSSTSIPGSTQSWEDPLITDLSDFDEDAFMAFNGPKQIMRDGRLGMGAMEGWGEMQKDWEEFQQSLPGVMGKGKGRERDRAADGRYLFQSRNPYTAEATAAVEQGYSQAGGRESPTVRGVLELEAAVQADPTDHHAWYALGLKQQENERESAAILALLKVLQLDPDYRPAYLALGVSYTNEGEHEAANKMIKRWIELAPSANQISAGVDMEDGTWQANQRILVDRLIGLARMSPDEVDPDVQVALGVLFNSSEQYDKAEDCLLAALAARPDDWLLYNRIGATLANSGRSNEALEYYHKALSLHPNFIRALFNMGISYMNISHPSHGAQRILEALRLQQADATEGYAAGTVGNAAKGVTSETLWQTLRSACLHMGRSDLVALATRKDLSGFPADISVVYGS